MTVSSSGDTPETIDTRQVTDSVDHDRFYHYVPKELIMEAAITGKPTRTLCGKMWLPYGDPEQYQDCPDCRNFYEGVVGTGPGAPKWPATIRLIP